MNTFSKSLIAAAIIASTASFAQAAVRITEVSPWSSANSVSYGTDWFELTNTGNNAINITGWKMDDSSAGSPVSARVALTGITTIKAGESVIFLEDISKKASFISAWFGGVAPVGLQFGGYTGNGVGLSQSGDAVYVFNAASATEAFVGFGASNETNPRTFDNSIGTNGSISLLSQNGQYHAFANAAGHIGSPGVVPEPETYAMFLAGLGMIGFVARKRQPR